MRIYGVILLVLALTFPSTILAQSNEGIRCVQAQLNADGFDAGPTDGLLGRQTKSALKLFEKKNGSISTRPFGTTLGNAYCRRIGLIRPELRRFWPSLSGKVTVVYADSVDAEFRNEFDRALAKPINAVSSLLDLQLAGRDIIVVAENPKELESLIKRHSSYKLIGLRQLVLDACGTFRNFSAKAAPGIAYFCKSPSASVQNGIERSWFDFVIAHEVLHLVQFQLSGAVSVYEDQKARLNAEGPVWLSEGSAQAFGNRMALGTPDWDYRIVNYDRLDRKFPNLRELESGASLENNKSNVYRAGTVAAIDLIDLEGYPAIMRMYEALGFGMPWRAAFHTAFGMHVEDYYGFYNSVRRFSDSGSPILGPLEK